MQILQRTAGRVQKLLQKYLVAQEKSQEKGSRKREIGGKSSPSYL